MINYLTKPGIANWPRKLFHTAVDN